MDETPKKFDLNIEKILESWETHHALREVIANALDEQALTQRRKILKSFEALRGNGTLEILVEVLNMNILPKMRTTRKYLTRT
jgi:hypothetical protein